MSVVKLEGAECKYCGSDDIVVEWKLRAKPIGSYSIAGAQPKVVAEKWPYATCQGCGHESEGERCD